VDCHLQNSRSASEGGLPEFPKAQDAGVIPADVIFYLLLMKIELRECAETDVSITPAISPKRTLALTLLGGSKWVGCGHPR
jgi:hypothetical protein